MARIHLPERERDAIVAGWLHDVAKFFDLDVMMGLIGDKYPEVQDESMRTNAMLQICGAEFVRENYDLFGIDDEEILDAIKYHTIGNGNMSVLSEIVYLADAIESERDWEGVETTGNWLRRIWMRR